MTYQQPMTYHKVLHLQLMTQTQRISMKVYYLINILLFFMTTKLNYKNYETLSDYWKDAQGKVPLAMMHGIQQFQKKHDLDFQTAYEILRDKKVIIEID